MSDQPGGEKPSGYPIHKNSFLAPLLHQVPETWKVLKSLFQENTSSSPEDFDADTIVKNAGCKNLYQNDLWVSGFVKLY